MDLALVPAVLPALAPLQVLPVLVPVQLPALGQEALVEGSALPVPERVAVAVALAGEPLELLVEVAAVQRLVNRSERSGQNLS